MENVERKSSGVFGWYFDTNLLLRILIGLVLGGILGLALANTLASEQLAKVMVWTDFFGGVFIRLLNMIMLPIIISTLIVGCSSVSPAQVGKVGIRVVIIYLLTSAFAVSTGLVMGMIFRPQAVLGQLTREVARTEAAQGMNTILLNIIPTNVFASINSAQVLPIIFFCLVFGLALSYLRMAENAQIKHAADVVYNVFDGIAQVVMKIIKGIMQYAPIGVLCLIFGVFARTGPQVAGALGVAVAAAFTGYAFHIVVIYGLLLLKLVGGLSIRRFARDAKEAFVTAAVTRSSNGTLPVTMTAAERLGIPKNVYSFSLPLGATINMDGTAIYQGVAVVFVALTVGHTFTAADIMLIIVTATLASIGTAGVPGAGAIMLILILQALGLPAEAGTSVALAYGLILGVDALFDMGRTALNVIGDLVCTTVVSKRLKLLDESKWV
jgi:Na+/H+-dicarboxylate symporter